MSSPVPCRPSSPTGIECRAAQATGHHDLASDSWPPPPPDQTNPIQARITELEGEITQLRKRSRSQVLMLEDEHTDLMARRQIAGRIAELQATITQREQAIATLRQETPPPPPDPNMVEELLATLPLLDGDLRGLPHPRLRELLDSLRLDARYDHRDHTADITITLADLGGQGDQHGKGCSTGQLRR